MIQIYDDMVTKDGVEVRHLVKKEGVTYWSVKLPCGHKQLARHSDLAAEITPRCTECSKAGELKARGVETAEQFKDWKDRKAIRLPHSLPVMQVQEETNAN
jgi:hypothetical protein